MVSALILLKELRGFFLSTFGSDITRVILTFSGHFVRYILLVLGWTHVCPQSCLNFFIA